MNYGCPYKKKEYGSWFESCKVTHEKVEGFVMCECDWESCADFQHAENTAKTSKVKHISGAIKEKSP